MFWSIVEIGEILGIFVQPEQVVICLVNISRSQEDLHLSKTETTDKFKHKIYEWL